MKTLKLYNYIRGNHKDLNLRERFILIDEVKRCCPAIKAEIEDLINGNADFSFALTCHDEGTEIVLSVDNLIKNFGMSPLQAYLYLNWYTEEPMAALDCLKRMDYLKTKPEAGSEEMTAEQKEILDSEI